MYKVETDSAMGVKVLGLNVRIGGRDVMITIEEARILEGNLREALHSPINNIPGDLLGEFEELKEVHCGAPAKGYVSPCWPSSVYYWDSYSTCMKGDIIA